MSLESRLAEALHRADAFEPSPDLFARVERSLVEDLAHRRRVRKVVGAALAAIILLGAFVAAFVSVDPLGRPTIPRWALEVLETVILIGLTLILGPTIRRFGKTYVGDVFRLDPVTGTRFLGLLDIAYYLVFFGLILRGVTLEALDSTVGLAAHLDDSFGRIAFQLLIMGLFHAATLSVLPVVGLIFSSVVRRTRRQQAGIEAPPVSPRAAQAERVVLWMVWGVGGLALLGLLIGVGMVIGFGIGSG